MAFEHRDITPEKRPEHAGRATRERVKTWLFFDLMRETMTNFDDAKHGKLALPKSELHNIEFFFRKSWDNFTEPLYEYDALMKEIEEKEWPSKGAKSRAINALKERRAKSLIGAGEILPDFEKLNPEKQKKALARSYEGYAAYLKEREDRFSGVLADKVAKGFDYALRVVLGVWGPRPEAGKERH